MEGVVMEVMVDKEVMAWMARMELMELMPQRILQLPMANQEKMEVMVVMEVTVEMEAWVLI